MKYTKELCYFLGFSWADGYLWSDKKNGSYRIILENNAIDLEEILEKVSKVGNFSLLRRSRKNSSKEILRATIYNKSLYEWMMANGFDDKNSPHTIVYTLPENLRRFFWLGLFDGDGCVGIYPRHNRNSTDYRIEFVSAPEQDWSSLSSLLEGLNVSYSIKQITNKNGNYSRLSIGKISDMVKLGEYLYSSYVRDRIGLKRKAEKFFTLISYGRTNT